MENIQRRVSGGIIKSQPKETPKVTLAVIAKDCPEDLRFLLNSCKEAQFDEIVVVDTGSRDGATKAAAQEFGAKVFDWKDPRPHFLEQFGHISDFAGARQFAFDQASNEYVMTLDCDDELVGGSRIKEILAQSIAKHGAAVGLIMIYEYYRDSRGQVDKIQKKFRLVRKADWKWACRVHEDLLAQRAVQVVDVPPELVRVAHRADMSEGARAKKDVRNTRILEDMLKEDGNLDLRMWKHLGHSYRGQARFIESNDCYMKHIQGSTWPEDIYISMTLIADNLRRSGDYLKALNWDLKASEMCVQFPQAYTGLALDELLLKRFDKAIFYAKQGLSCDQDTTDLEFEPKTQRQALWQILSEGLRETGKTNESLQCLHAIKQEFPSETKFDSLIQLMESTIADATLGMTFSGLIEELESEGDAAKAKSLIESAPKRVRDLPIFSYLKWKKPPNERPSVAILCPGGGWGPKAHEKGIGGSEEAVIFLSKELAKLGLWVDVFTGTDEHGEIDGVRWYPYATMKPEYFYDTVIIWRWPELLDQNWTCSNLWVWCHDVQFENRWNDARIAKVDKVIFLSKYHREGAPWIPEEKALYSSNGLSPDFFEPLQNDPKQVIFASNPTRGLGDVLKMWPEIHQKTGAILHTFYGFTDLTKQAFANNPLETRKMHEIQSLLEKTDGVVNHGMVGQKELAEWTSQCGLSFFPTEFPEISCITMMRNQAMGAIPVCSSFAALDETVKWGTLVPPGPSMLQDAKLSLIHWLENPQKQETIRGQMVAWAREKFPWELVAKQWFKEMEGKPWTPNSVLPQVEDTDPKNLRIQVMTPMGLTT